MTIYNIALKKDKDCDVLHHRYQRWQQQTKTKVLRRVLKIC